MIGLGQTLWWLSCGPEYWAFRQACGRVEGSQRACLRRILGWAQGSQWARRYDLHPGLSPQQFQAHMPVTDYADYEESIAAMGEGRLNVLTGSPLRLFEPTSGTKTSKLIPYTKGLQLEFRRAISAWVGALMAQYPRLLSGRHYWSITPPAGPPQRTSAGIPIGFEEDSQYLSGWSARLLQSFLIRPGPFEEQHEHWQVTLDSLTRCPDLTFVSVWSPTYWLHLLERLPQEPAQLWSGLALLSCWGDGYSANYLDQLQACHPALTIQKKGLIATEAFCSLPWGKWRCLALRSHFFEFLDEQGRPWLAHQLNLGQTYELLVTTGGGLYRYRLGDRVLVDGFWRQCPSLTFLGRVGLVSDRFGEKLSAEQIHLPSGLAFVAYEPQRRAYTLFSSAPSQAAGELEESLRRNNFHYDLCRRQGQLQAIAAFQLGDGAWESFYRRLQQRQSGLARAGDFKPVPLRSEEDWSQFLPGGFVDVAERV
jgi:hypothetical protein